MVWGDGAEGQLGVGKPPKQTKGGAYRQRQPVPLLFFESGHKKAGRVWSITTQTALFIDQSASSQCFTQCLFVCRPLARSTKSSQVVEVACGAAHTVVLTSRGEVCSEHPQPAQTPTSLESCPVITAKHFAVTYGFICKDLLFVVLHLGTYAASLGLWVGWRCFLRCGYGADWLIVSKRASVLRGVRVERNVVGGHWLVYAIAQHIAEEAGCAMASWGGG